MNFLHNTFKKVLPLRAGFEPAREDPIGFQVQRLNHSAIAAPLSPLPFIRIVFDLKRRFSRGT